MPFPGSPCHIPSIGRRPDTGDLEDTGHLTFPFVYCSTLQREQASAISDWNSSTCGICLPPASRHPQSREDQRLDLGRRGSERDGLMAVEPEAPLSPSTARPNRAVSLLIGWDVGTSTEEAKAIQNQFSVEDLRFKDLKQWYFSAAQVFRFSCGSAIFVKLIKIC